METEGLIWYQSGGGGAYGFQLRIRVGNVFNGKNNLQYNSVLFHTHMYRGTFSTYRVY